MLGYVSFITDAIRNFAKLKNILETFHKNSTHFAPNWVLLMKKWYSEGSQNYAVRVIMEKVEISKPA